MIEFEWPTVEDLKDFLEFQEYADLTDIRNDYIVGIEENEEGKISVIYVALNMVPECERCLRRIAPDTIAKDYEIRFVCNLHGRLYEEAMHPVH